jgi:hypothetical protein
MANYNIDSFLRAKKTVQLADIEIDISMVPLIVNMSLDVMAKEMQAIAKREERNESTEADVTAGTALLEKMFELAEIIIRKNDNPDFVNRDWLMKNVDNFGLWSFITIAASKDSMVAKSIDSQEPGRVASIKKKGRKR